MSLQIKFSALGDKTRYTIVQAMINDENWCVSEYAEKLELTPAAISQHMKILEQAEIVRPSRKGRRVCYELERDEPDTKQLIAVIRAGE